MFDSEKTHYFAISLMNVLLHRGFQCPSCGISASRVVSRKYLVTTLRRCQGCSLLYRAPTTDQEQLKYYYRNQYQSGFTTELPDDETLKNYLKTGFVETPKDFTRYLKILEALGAKAGSRILDLGCSWGYGVWQLRQAGYDASGFEVGEDRAVFARNRLDVPVFDDLNAIDMSFDYVFSSHVLEHIAALRPTLETASKLLKPDGLVIAITPNGSEEFRQRSPSQWNRLWGFKHPLFLDGEFWQQQLYAQSYILTTDLNDLAAMKAWHDKPEPTVGSLGGWELLTVFKNQGADKLL